MRRLAVIGVVVVAACGSGEGDAPPGVSASGGAVASAAPAASGEQLYGRYCAACHGVGGVGTPVAPRPLQDAGYLAATPDSVLRGRIANGVPGTAMAPWGGMLSADQLDALVGTIRSFAPADGATTTASPPPAGG